MYIVQKWKDVILSRENETERTNENRQYTHRHIHTEFDSVLNVVVFSVDFFRSLFYSEKLNSNKPQGKRKSASGNE